MSEQITDFVRRVFGWRPGHSSDTKKANEPKSEPLEALVPAASPTARGGAAEGVPGEHEPEPPAIEGVAPAGLGAADTTFTPELVTPTEALSAAAPASEPPTDVTSGPAWASASDDEVLAPLPRRPHCVASYSVPKRGNRSDENEDARAVGPSWLAVADGATELSFSRRWARLIVGALRIWWRTHDRLDREAWCAQIPWVQERQRRRLPLELLQRTKPYVYEKAMRGAGATVLCARFDDREFEASGVGDCNLFLFDADDHLVLAQPRTDPGQFNTSPDLLPSLPGSTLERALAAVWTIRGRWARGQSLVLCTDAVSAYLLRFPEGDLSFRPSALRAGGLAWFAEWVARSREHGMKNDDSTVAIAINFGQGA